MRACIPNNTQALLNSVSEANAMSPAYAAEPGLLVRKTELELKRSTAPP